MEMKMHRLVAVLILLTLLIVAACSGDLAEERMLPAASLLDMVDHDQISGLQRLSGRFGGIGNYRNGKPQHLIESLFQDVGTEFSVNVAIPLSKPELEFHSGFYCAPGTPPALILAEVAVTAGEITEVIYQQKFWVRRPEVDYVYYAEALDLSRWAGQEVSLTFKTSSLDGKPVKASVAWGNPRIFSAQASDKPNIILICIDALRTDYVSSYNSDSDLTPNLQKLAADGILFENATTQAPFTLASVSSVLSGLYPAMHGAGKRILIATNPTPEKVREMQEKIGLIHQIGDQYLALNRLSNDVPILPELLKGSYETHAVNGNSFISSVSNVVPRFRSLTDMTMHGKLLTENAVNWLEANGDKQFFLYMHYMEPHEWVGHLEERGGENADHKMVDQVYSDLVRMNDEYLGRFINQLKKQGLYDDSLIIFYSDHGEHLYEKDGHDIGHGVSMRHEMLQVPLMMKLPENQRAGERVGEPVALMDIFKTIADAAGLELDTNKYRHLKSLAEAGAEPSSSRQIFSEYMLYGGERKAVTQGAFKLVRFLPAGREELRNSYTDEVIDNPEMKDILSKHLDGYIAFCAEFKIDIQRIEATSEEAEKLKQLGYIN
jgi:arylsulfatase A-like enzyme